jgi:hypothetical protein
MICEEQMIAMTTAELIVLGATGSGMSVTTSSLVPALPPPPLIVLPLIISIMNWFYIDMIKISYQIMIR